MGKAYWNMIQHYLSSAIFLGIYVAYVSCKCQDNQDPILTISPENANVGDTLVVTCGWTNADPTNCPNYAFLGRKPESTGVQHAIIALCEENAKMRAYRFSPTPQCNPDEAHFSFQILDGAKIDDSAQWSCCVGDEKKCAYKDVKITDPNATPQDTTTKAITTTVTDKVEETTTVKDVVEPSNVPSNSTSCSTCGNDKNESKLSSLYWEIIIIIIIICCVLLTLIILAIIFQRRRKKKYANIETGTGQ